MVTPLVLDTSETGIEGSDNFGWLAKLSDDTLTLSKVGKVDVTFNVAGCTVNSIGKTLSTGDYAWSVRGCLVRGTVDTIAATVILDLSGVGLTGDDATVALTGLTAPCVIQMSELLMVGRYTGPVDECSAVEPNDKCSAVEIQAFVDLGEKETAGDAYMATFKILERPSCDTRGTGPVDAANRSKMVRRLKRRRKPRR